MRSLALLAGLAVASCSSSPDNPVNQTPPIRALDNMFRSMSGSSPPSQPDPTHEPGYAPAYPPFEP